MSTEERGYGVVAIDGLAGSGKTAVSQTLAEELKIGVLNTGLYFRMAALLAWRRGLDAADERAMESALALSELRVGNSSAFLDGEMLDEAVLRGDEVQGNIGGVASNPIVRAHLMRLERNAVEQLREAVVEGRDIGTVVFPEATVKVFLVARREVRQRRRPEEPDVAERDNRDRQRRHAPLAFPEGAFTVDTSDLSVGDIVTRLAFVCRSRGLGKI
ncbi:MAG: (d)CMP kinase [Ferrimicrobium sp.]